MRRLAAEYHAVILAVNAVRGRKIETWCALSLPEMNPTRILVLACGNSLRGDDGAGPWLSEWASRRFKDDPQIRVIARQQWTPDLAEEIARARAVLFIDCSLEVAPGSVNLLPVAPNPDAAGIVSHHLSAPELLAVARHLYNAMPEQAVQLAIGAGSVALGEEFSQPVAQSLNTACERLEEAVLNLLERQP